MKTLGLDIGGAHVKSAVVKSGATALARRKIYPFEIYRNHADLTALLDSIIEKSRPDRIALTMTGELSDTFANRTEGVRFILDSVRRAAQGRELRIVNVEGDLVPFATAQRRPASVASANWAATARWVATRLADCLIVDIGSTTTDLLPVKNGKCAVIGKTDYQRMRNGELLYTGYLRANSACVCPVIRINGKRIVACPEYFSIVGDAHLYLGNITAKDYTTPTPDGGAKTKRGASMRLARLVLSDVKTLNDDGIRSIARQILTAQNRMIATAIDQIIEKQKLKDAPVILIGHGRLYKNAIKRNTPDKLDGTPVDRIDPAACAAALYDL